MIKVRTQLRLAVLGLLAGSALAIGAQYWPGGGREDARENYLPDHRRIALGPPAVSTALLPSHREKHQRKSSPPPREPAPLELRNPDESALPPSPDKARAVRAAQAEAAPWFESSGETGWRRHAVAADRLSQGPKVAVIIDDVGLDHGLARRAIALEGPVTLSFLPYADGLPKLARAAAARGKEIMVHLPMEPKSDARDPGPHALLLEEDEKALDREIAWNLNRFSGFVGVNNHMGSRFTENRQAMAALFGQLRKRGLLFIDSRTTAKSVGAKLADQMRLAYAERDVFLDNDQDAHMIIEQLRETEARARRQGTAIAIGHPHPATLKALAAWISTLPSKDIALVPITDIVETRATPLWRLAYEQGESGSAPAHMGAGAQ